MMDDAETWKRWRSEIDFAQKDQKYVDWLKVCEGITRRYRDERSDAAKLAGRRLNMLWSNVQTFMPAIYPAMPKPVVERKFMDRDPAARLASTILERCLVVQMGAGYYNESVKLVVQDRLLAGMGQTWIRYEPVIEADQAGYKNKAVDAKEKTANQVEQDGDGTPYERIAYERVCTDYLYYKDFLWGPARYWREVPWVARRCWLTKSEIKEAYPDVDVETITLDYTPERMSQKGMSDASVGYFKKAEVWEIWNKADQTVYIIPYATPGVIFKQEKPVLQLEGFWPCTEPLFATQTNDTIVPVPDYSEYRDQAVEIDDLTNRISMLTTALRVNGVYNSEYPEIARLLQDGMDNKLVPVDSWAAFAEKGGLEGSLSLVPIKEIMETLTGLYEARQAAKDDMFEISGMSDLMRGQGQASETATAARIKGQFGSMRLEDQRQKVARFCLDNIRIIAEVICEQFAPETLMQMSGVDLMIGDEVRKAVEAVPPPPPPEQPQPTGDPRMDQVQAMQAQAQAAAMQAQAAAMQQQAAQQVQQKKLAEFQQAVQILKSDKLRGFRVDIETVETIEADTAEEQQATDSLIQGTIAALTEAGPIIMQAPELLDPIGKLLMLGFRRHRVGRTVESSLEDALDQMKAKLEGQKNQPPPPSPEQLKAQTDMAMKEKQAQIDQQKAEQDAQLQQQKSADESEARRQEMEMKREEHAMQMAQLAAKAQQAKADQQAKAEDRGVAREEAMFKRDTAQEEQQRKRETHQMAMDTAKAGRDGERAKLGMPPEDQSAKIADATAQGLEAMADAVRSMGENIGKGMDALAVAVESPRSVMTPDGREFTSKVKR